MGKEKLVILIASIATIVSCVCGIIFALPPTLVALRQLQSESFPSAAQIEPLQVPTIPSRLISPTPIAQIPTIPLPTALPSKTFTPPAVGSLLYQADWSNGLDGWPGNYGWKVVSGMLVNDGSTSDSVNWIAAPYAPIPTPNYAVETEMQLLRNPGCGSYGIVLREVYQIGIHICPGQKILALVRGASGVAGIGEIAYTPPATVWHKFRIEAKGNSFRILIDGSNILEVSDNTNLSAGKVGLWSDRTQINVRTFKVFAQ